MFYVYILFSKSSGKYYCGQTNNLYNRILQHNNGESLSTKSSVPWILIGVLVFDNRTEAMKKEKAIKLRGIKRWLGYAIDSLDTSFNNFIR